MSSVALGMVWLLRWMKRYAAMPLGVSPLMLREVHIASRFCSISFVQSSMMEVCCWLACFVWDLRSMIIRRKKK